MESPDAAVGQILRWFLFDAVSRRGAKLMRPRLILSPGIK